MVIGDPWQLGFRRTGAPEYEELAESMYEAIIGLECHAQLDTRTKLFCSCPVVETDEPNVAICPVCTGHPGTLPVLNTRAVHLALMAAAAVSCTVHRRSVFARKQYFYPDLPKGYQISQFERPIATDGALTVSVGGVERSIGIQRIHLEEDAGKSLHERGAWRVDFNRCGVPLIEIVSRAEMRTPAEAFAYLRILHRVLVEAGICKGDMEKGHFRCDVNVSVHRPDEPWGTRVEVKNVNSFRFVAKAIQFEIERQIALLDRGESVVQETRTWRGDKTVSMRQKEGSSDYRYYPDPDLPVLEVDEAEIVAAKDALPGAPLDRWLVERDVEVAGRFRATYGLDAYAAGVLLGQPELCRFFEAAVAAGGAPVDLANWVIGELLRRVNEGRHVAESRLSPEALVALQNLVDEGLIARGSARELIDVLWRDGGDPRALVASRGLQRVSDDDRIREAVRAAISANPIQAGKYREGNQGMIGFFMGQVMKATQQRADPELTRRIIEEELSGRLS